MHNYLVTSIVASVLIHIVVLSVSPQITTAKKGEWTSRDIKFFVEEVFLDRAVPPAPASIKPVTSSAEETPQPANQPAVAASPQNPWTVSLHPATGGRDNKNSRSSADKTAEEIQERIRDIEVKDISAPASSAAPRGNRYIEIVHRQLQDKYFVPPEAKIQQARGEVMLEVTIYANGRIKDIKFISRSDFPVLDMAAEQCVRRAAPFPDISNLVDFKEFSFRVPFRY
ncbi:MAG: TonB family protein [Planctomycetes bacterium]|nr:TonB family protein [Planctomycetota bacterium]